jgi:hypothetical protein
MDPVLVSSPARAVVFFFDRLVHHCGLFGAE